jgi:hypothetical protein
MRNDGKKLEELVAFVESQLLPARYDVRTNTCVRNDDGIQIAEFDVEVRGMLGSTEISWLIECRDRPSAGKAPASWIEQLYGRRNRFNFNKVTAVSTTGFAPDAIEFAKQEGIELREVASLSPDNFSDWIIDQEMDVLIHHHELTHFELVFDENEKSEIIEGINKINFVADAPLLIPANSDKAISAIQAFIDAASLTPNEFNGLEPNGLSKTIRLWMNYNTDIPFYVVKTEAGMARVWEAGFVGEVSVKTQRIPLKGRQYKKVGDERAIAHSFEGNLEVAGQKGKVTFHVIPK